MGCSASVFGKDKGQDVSTPTVRPVQPKGKGAATESDALVPLLVTDVSGEQPAASRQDTLPTTKWFVKSALETSPKRRDESGDAALDENSEKGILAKYVRWDRDEDGVLNRYDLFAALEPLGLSQEEMDRVYDACDKDGKGHIAYDDFRLLFQNMPEDLRAPTNPVEDVVIARDTSPKSSSSERKDENDRSHLAGLASGIKAGSLGILVLGAKNVPKMDWFTESDPYLKIEVCHRDNITVAKERTFTINAERNPQWNQLISLPGQGKRQRDVLPAEWDLDSTVVKFTLIDADYFFDDFIGECTLPLLELIEKPVARLMLWDKQGEAVLGSLYPSMPCEISVSIIPETMPAKWTKAHDIVKAPPSGRYPCHVFMMTRGTRGDVQPFVALARGLAEQLGWMVTICTELRWKSFVKSNANVSKGRIRFRPSGGDTELRMTGAFAQWAVKAKSEMMQMTIMASSEREFFPSATVFVEHVMAYEETSNPVDMLVFGLTVGRVAALISDLCEKRLVGFIMQPSCIPSKDADWPAVQPLSGSGGRFTSHASLQRMKEQIEQTRFARFNLNHLRDSFKLPTLDTYQTMREKEVPIIIPMRGDTFTRPTDWWEGITLTDFIFLRSLGKSVKAFGEPLETFLKAARAASAKVGLMTFSSMPVARKAMLTCSAKMLEECNFNLRLIYVGKRGDDRVPQDLERRAKGLADTSRFLELDRADFGILFKEMDCFIVHGGLGTTVEALRLKKPCCVTGPLLLDQRFWGSVCHQKGVGPEPVHIEDFHNTCVQFVDGALDPSDPYGWQANALKHDWGVESDDGVSCNVEKFAGLKNSWKQDSEDQPVVGPVPSPMPVVPTVVAAS